MSFRATAPVFLSLLHVGLWSLWLLWTHHALAAAAGNPQYEFHWWFWLSHPSAETAFRALTLTNALVVAWLWTCYRASLRGTRAAVVYAGAALLEALLLLATREVFSFRAGLGLEQIVP